MADLEIRPVIGIRVSANCNCWPTITDPLVHSWTWLLIHKQPFVCIKLLDHVFSSWFTKRALPANTHPPKTQPFSSLVPLSARLKAERCSYWRQYVTQRVIYLGLILSLKLKPHWYLTHNFQSLEISTLLYSILQINSHIKVINASLGWWALEHVGRKINTAFIS
jgi:hypothetical protein